VALGLLLSFVSAAGIAVAYVFSRLFLARGSGRSLRLLAIGHVWMGAIAAVVTVALWPDDMPPVRRWLPLVALCSGFYLLAQVLLFVSLRRTDASRVAPLIGLKVLAVALIRLLAFGRLFTPLQWLAVLLSVAATFALNRIGGRLPKGVVVGILLVCLGYACSDIFAFEIIEALDGRSFQITTLSAALCYVVCGLAGLALLPAVGVRPGRDWLWALPFSVAWLGAVACTFAAFARVGVVFTNIVQSTRGLWSILLGAAVARAGLIHLERLRSRGEVLRRLAAAALMSAAIALFTWEEARRPGARRSTSSAPRTRVRRHAKTTPLPPGRGSWARAASQVQPSHERTREPAPTVPGCVADRAAARVDRRLTSRDRQGAGLFASAPRAGERVKPTPCAAWVRPRTPAAIRRQQTPGLTQAPAPAHPSGRATSRRTCIARAGPAGPAGTAPPGIRPPCPCSQ